MLTVSTELDVGYYQVLSLFWAFMVLERSECSDKAECGTAISSDYFPTDLCGDFAMEAETGTHIIFQDIG
jgi:hypothetical protein